MQNFPTGFLIDKACSQNTRTFLRRKAILIEWFQDSNIFPS